MLSSFDSCMPSLNPVALSKFLNLSKFPFPTCKTWMIIAATTHSAMRLKQAFSSVQFSHLVVSDSLRTPRTAAHQASLTITNSRSLLKLMSIQWWCHPTISSSIVPFSSHLQSFPAPGSFPVSQFFALGGQSIGASASASVLPINIQSWFPLGLSGCISLQPKGLSRVFSNTTVQQHQFFSVQFSL